MTEELKDMYWAGEIGCPEFINRAFDLDMPVEEIEAVMAAVRAVDGVQ